jgi:hypothetical protein
MGGMTKERLIEEAKRLNINIEGLTYQEASSKVFAALRQLKDERREAIGIPEGKPHRADNTEVRRPLPSMDQLKGKTIMFAPEMAPTKIQLIKYDELISPTTPVVEEVYAGELVNKEEDYQRKYASYRIKNVSNRPNIAQSTLPQLNPGITYRPDTDLTAVITYRKQKGYSWKKIPVGKFPDGTVCFCPGIYDMLKDTFPEYLERFNKDKLFYLGTTKLCCDIPFTHAIFREIEQKEREKERLGLT